MKLKSIILYIGTGLILESFGLIPTGLNSLGIHPNFSDSKYDKNRCRQLEKEILQYSKPFERGDFSGFGRFIEIRTRLEEGCNIPFDKGYEPTNYPGLFEKP
jgi:hypothetical protein